MKTRSRLDDLPEGLLHELVARQAALTGDAVAVVDGTTALTYAELDASANRLANLLQGRGIGVGDLVGVRMRRGAGLAVALLGVWRAGAAYLPLDPEHPEDRLDWILADARPRLVLTADVLDELTAWPDTAPLLDVPEHSAAYLIYTSGSTGRPKGVLVTNAGIANRVRWTVRTHELGVLDRVLQKTSLSFDAHCWEFFAPLISGGAVVMAPHGAERDPAQLVGALAAHDITVLQVVPSVLRMLVDERGWDEVRSLRLLFSAGEPLRAELRQRLLRLVKVEVWNTYGPTECAIDVAAHPFDPEQISGPVPIGRPIDNTWLLVLDDAGDPVPVGVAGELHAGGAGLAVGYHGRPDLTAARFVPDPYGEPGSRLYRTGDLVRWLPDHTLEYLGRIDDQVKVNGVRIEPGEVEAALGTHPLVRAAVVTAVADDPGIRLVGYAVADGVTSEALRAHCRGLLPEPMVPSVFVLLDELPLTASGKVDRAALPAPRPESGRPPYVAPRTAAERLVAGVWAELIGVTRIGVHDDFFQLGGSSLMLTRLAHGLRAASGGEVKMRGLFEAFTVEAQAALLGSAVSEEDSIVAVPRDGALPLSFGQQRLWFLDQMRPGHAEWVSPNFLRLPASFDADVVREALARLEARHEILRIRYVVDAGRPRQVIAEPGPVELRVVDGVVEDLPELFGQQFARGFDLETGPLWRALLVRIPGRDHVLLVTAHHIASDGWSTVVAERELTELCTALHEGRAPALAPAGQYADYAAWQQRTMTDFAAEISFWRGRLDGLEPVRLPTDYTRPAERDPSGAAELVTIPAALADELTALGRRHGATPFMTLLTAFSMLLARCTGQRDLGIGTPVTGRDRPETRTMLGFFLNSLVLRCDLAGDPTFTEALARTRARVLEAFAHQDVPFERLVDELQPVRDLSRTPLYQVAFDLQEDGTTSVAADADAGLAFHRAWRIAKTDLTLFAWRRADGALIGSFEYATALFDARTVRRLADHFVALLAEVTARPDAPLSEVDFMAPDERTWLVDGLNRTAVGEVSRSVLELFEEQADESPDAVAVICGDARLTFAELDARANRFAHHLSALGVGAESVVGVLLDRSPDLVASLLGVWKAGAAYLPLDVELPGERMAVMLADAGARVVITEKAFAAKLAGTRVDGAALPTGNRVAQSGGFAGTAHPAGFPGTQVLTDDDRTEIDHRPATRPSTPADLARCAYVIYTSGSTGHPKGVVVSHQGLANHVWWAAEVLAGRGTTGAPLFSSIAFDLPVPNLYAPLVTGQPVHLMPTTDLARLGRWLVAEGPFSFIKLTPGHLELLSHQLSEAEARTLAGVIVVAGEALPAGVANHWLGVLGPGGLINEYGPTEASVGTSIHPVTAPVGTDVTPIGLPLPNMTMYVLDADMRPVPVGVTGELYVGGTGVARGYLGQAGLTAQRFVPDPYGEPGARIYRTGDLVRRLPDGAVDFQGRVDHQVKIRGYRVELGEIEAVLREVVREAVVVYGEHGLVAYHVGEAADLAQHCAARLPRYMVPDHFVVLDAMPLNRNGKVDHSKLPGTSGEDADVTAPSTPAEERILAIWTELLGTEVGVHNDFFTAGGNSILAIRLIAGIQDEFEITMPVRLIFERPTIAGLAAAVEDLIRAEIAELTSEELAVAIPLERHDA